MDLHSATRADRGIAVVGLAGRFPGAASVAELWRNVRNGVESIRFFAPDEERDSVPETQRPDSRYVPAKGYLEGWDGFDAPFFGYPAREAALMDPQIRLLHECVWEALEDAGYAPDAGLGSVGLYVGGSSSPQWFCASQQRRRTAAEVYQGVVMNDNQAFSTRLSYTLGLCGPSVTLQTACSSSLVALHAACRALAAGDCRMAIAGGVSIVFPVKAGYVFEEGGVSSPDGHCRAFDADGRGTLAGDGCALAVLKPLRDAMADGDRIYAVILGTAVNNDGNDKIGYTAPSVSGQADVIRRALSAAGVDPETIGYLEAHGTGTPLGDPIEIEAATQAFATPRRQYCAVGSVKTNLGHLNHAAGIAGFIKAVMALHEGVLPPSLHFRAANPHIDFASTPFYVNAVLRPWESEGPRRAAVSSFGIGGTNAHAVLEEAPPLPPRAAETGTWQLLVLSARQSRALEESASRLRAHLEAHRTVDLHDAAFTLQVGRSAHRWRRAVLCRSVDDAARALGTSHGERVWAGSSNEAPSALAYLLPGHGAQYAGMIAGLCRRFGIVRAAIDECLSLVDRPLRNALQSIFDPRAAAPDARARMDDARLAQPAIFISQYACATLLRRLGLVATALAGHGVGEIVAAALAGVFRLGDALSLVIRRADMVHARPPGAMLTVALAAAEAEARLTPDVSLSAIDAAERCVVSGPTAAIEALARRLTREGVACRRLAVSHAFHSGMMDPILAELERTVRALPRRPPSVPFLSNVTGRWIAKDQAMDPAYWARQTREPVRFAECLDTLLRTHPPALIDLGPGDTLAALARSHPSRRDDTAVARLLPRAAERQDDDACALAGIAHLWVRGFDVTWSVLHDTPRRRVSLPTYPFQREALPDITIDARETGPGSAAELQTIFYTPAWRPAPDSSSTVTPRRLLFFAPSRAAPTLAEAYRLAGHDVVLVRQAERRDRRERAGCLELGIRLSEPADYVCLFEELDPGWFPTHVVHAWSLDAGGTGDCRRTEAHVAREAGFYSVLWLAQAMASRPFPGGVRLHIVTRDATSAPGTRTVRPAQSPVAALGVVVSQECSGVHCTHADVATEDILQEGEAAVLRRAIDRALAGDGDRVVAWRRGVGWTPSVVPWPVPAPPAGSGLRQGGVYLITGGFGDIGLALAETWIRAAGARVALVGRLVPAPPDPRAARLSRLVSEGADLLTFAADCTDAERMHAVIEAVRRRWGAVHGVVHAAAATRGNSIATPIAALDRGACDEQFAAKATGLLVLREALGDDQADFVLVMSSLSSIVGGLGLGAYAGACRFQDACVEAWSRESRTRWIAVNWDGWDFPGRAPAVHERLPLLQPAEGVDACARALAHAGPPRVLVSKTDLRLRQQQWLELDAARVDGAPRDARPMAETAGIERAMAEVWREFFGVARIEAGDSFYDLDGDSLGAVALVARMNAALGLRLQVPDLLEAPTVAQLARRLRRRGAPAAPRLGRAEAREAYPLSFEQEAILSPRNAAYATRFNCTAALDVDEPLDPARLERAFQDLLARHEILRTAFDTGRGLQRIASSAPFTLGVRPVPDAGVARASEAFVRPFDVTKAPLLRAELLQVPGGRSRLVLDVHHAVTDAVSLGTMLSEIWRLYDGAVLPRVDAHYRDYALWQRRAAASGRRDLDAWRRELGDGFWTELPPDVRGAPRSVKQLTVAVDPPVRARLREAAERRQVTVATLLMAAVAATLRDYTRQHQVTFGVRVSRRDEASLERMLGPFVEDAVCRVPLDGADDGHEVVARMQTALAAVLERPACSYDRLNAALQAERPTPTGGLFAVMVNYVPDLAVDGTRRARVALVPRAPDTQYLVNLRLRDGDVLRLDAKYRADRHTEPFMRGVLDHIVTSAEAIASGLATAGAAAAGPARS